MPTFRIAELVGAGLIIAAGGAWAQTGKPSTPAPSPSSDAVDQLLPSADKPSSRQEQGAAVNDGEAYHRAPDEAQTPEELEATRALNAEIAARNQKAEASDQASQQAYDAARSDYERTVAEATQAQLAYEEGVRQAEAAQRAWEADRDRAERARAAWEASTRPCAAGRCVIPR